MTIWILAVLLLASLAGLGYRQGVIRVAFSFLGIVLGAALAVPLARLVRPGLSAVGLQNPVLLWLLAPFIVFVIVLSIFKIAGLAVHGKVEVYYKYKAGELRLALWERLSRRLGLCLGLANGVAYLVLISFVIYIFSYWTIQMTTSDSDPKIVRLFNRMGRDLESTGMVIVARAIDGMPAEYYDTADIVGLAYHTPLLEARLYRYPAFLGLAERPEFQDLFSDKQFMDLWQRQASVRELVDYPKIKAILKNPDTLKLVWNTVAPNLKDLRTFLETGQSPKYDPEKILGRWTFDVNGVLALIRKAKPNITSSEMERERKTLAPVYANTTLVATTEQKAILKNFPRMKITPGAPPGTPPTIESQTWQGQWKNTDGKYELTFNVDGKTQAMAANIEGDRLSLVGLEIGLAFVRED